MCAFTSRPGRLTKDLVHDARERCGGVDCHTVFLNVLFRMMQPRDEFPFAWLSALVVWVNSAPLRGRPVWFSGRLDAW
jgi:hypothetical protein